MMMYKLYWEEDGVYWKYTEDVTGSEIIKASIQIYGDQRFDNLRYKIVDFIDIASICMEEEEIKSVAFQHQAAAKSNPSVKTAIIIDERYLEAANLFSSLFKDSSWEVKVFNNIEQANHWTCRVIPDRTTT